MSHIGFNRVSVSWVQNSVCTKVLLLSGGHFAGWTYKRKLRALGERRYVYLLERLLGIENAADGPLRKAMTW